MNLANRSLTLRLDVIVVELYAPSKSARMGYPGAGRNDADAVTKFRPALVGIQPQCVCQGSHKSHNG